MTAGLTDTLSNHPLIALATLFGAGVATSTFPCIYPMIPITMGILSGATGAHSSRARTARLTLTYAAGLALFYALLGLIAGLTGSLFGTVSASWWARLAIGNLLLVFGLAMLDVIPVSAPQRLLQWVGGLSGGSYPTVFLLGATSGIVAAPCGAPVFAGTRVPVQSLLDYLAAGHPLDEFLEDFPTVSREQACELLDRLKETLQDAEI